MQEALLAAIDYTYVAGRARVKHTARLDRQRLDAAIKTGSGSRAQSASNVDIDVKQEQSVQMNEDPTDSPDAQRTNERTRMPEGYVGDHYAVTRSEFTLYVSLHPSAFVMAEDDSRSSTVVRYELVSPTGTERGERH